MNDPNRPKDEGRFCDPDRAHETKRRCITKAGMERWEADKAKEKEEAARRSTVVDAPSSDDEISDDEMAEALSGAIREVIGFGSDDDEGLFETALEAAFEEEDD